MRKTALFAALCVAALASGVARADEKAADEKKPSRQGVVVHKTGPVIIEIQEVAEADEKGARPKVRLKAVRVGGKQGAKAPRLLKVQPVPREKLSPKPRPSAGGWLGIRVSPVPAAVASQLALKDEGVMVLNLLKGSPAEKAGLDRYDVIVRVGDGEKVAGVEAFLASIQSRKPGGKVALTVLRQGREKSVTVALGESSDRKAEYVYEDDADELWQDRLRLHKGMLRKGPGGWIFQGSGGAKIDLPKDLLKNLPRSPWPDIELRVGASGGGKTSLKLSRTVDGRTLEIDSEGDGKIVVRRRQAGDDKTVTRTYNSAEELRKADAEAYELYQGVRVGRRGAGWPRGAFPLKDLVVPGKEAGEAAKRLEKELRVQFERFNEGARRLAEQARGGARAARSGIARALDDEPQRKFEVDEKGRITVEVREGGSQAKLTFQDEQDLAKRAPKLHRAYEKLLKDVK